MKNKRRILTSIIWIVLGLGLNVAGFVAELDNFWTGIGSGFLFVGILQLIRWSKYSRNDQYREMVDVETNDERNRYLAAKAWSWAGYMFVIISAVVSIVFYILDLRTLGIAAGTAVSIIIFLYWISYIVLKRKY